jgi:hypothetical protein
VIHSWRVVVPPTSTDMTTVAAISSELKSTEDAVYLNAPALIKQASRMIVKYIGRELAFRTIEETLKWEWLDDPLSYYHSNILLTQPPVRDLSSIVGDGTTWDLTEVTLSAGIIQGCKGARNTVITYTTGYYMPGDALRDLPDDLERACIDTVVALWYRPDRGDPSIKMDRVDGVGLTSYYDQSPTNYTGLPPTALGILDDYKVSR